MSRPVPRNTPAPDHYDGGYGRRKNPKEPMKTRLLKIQDWETIAREAKYKPETMAALCPVTLRHLERFFRDRFHKPPREWAREYRCRLARELISRDLSNKAVVIELSFGNQAQLCHDFHRVYGVSPQSFAPLYEARPARQAAQSVSPPAAAACI
jgi:transcriptional regulator GlxA family with amidase domain